MSPLEPDIARGLIEDAEKNGMQPLDKMYLDGDAAVAVVAGSDSTAPSMIMLLWQMAQHPEHCERVFNEVKSVDLNDYGALARLPHLNGCIQENLRLFPPIMSLLQRLVPTGGIVVEGHYIPEGTTLNAPRYSISRRKYTADLQTIDRSVMLTRPTS